VDRFDDVRRAVHRTVDVAIAEKVDAYAFLGDLCDPDDAPRALRAVELMLEVERRLSAECITSYWLAGNHCVIEDGSGRTVLSPMRALQSVRSKSEVHLFEGAEVRRDFGNVAVLALPFTASSHPYDPAEFVRQAAAYRETFVVLSHLAVPGIQPGEETTEMPRGREVILPVDALLALKQRVKKLVVLSGHYHRAQTVDIRGLEVHVVGSVERLTFGEERHDPSFLILEV
jgi:DNA repair exonuclease SbcCD nuclease subunit